MISRKSILAMFACGLVAIGLAACGDDNGGGSSDLSGTIRLDGSSTVFPFAQAAAELFKEDNPNVKISVGEAGTSGGFEKFCVGETDISTPRGRSSPRRSTPARRTASPTARSRSPTTGSRSQPTPPSRSAA